MPVQIVITKPDNAVGSSAYTLTITVTNTGQTEISGVEAQPLVLPGRLLAASVEVNESEESELVVRRRELIDEMEHQVTNAYESQRYQSLSPYERLMDSYMRVIDIYAALFAFGRRGSTLVPSWTRQAFRIHDWQDVEMLENQVIAKLKPESPIRAAYSIDKEKLRRCLEALNATQSQEKPLPGGTTLMPGGSVSFPFTAKAPHLLKRRDVDVQLQITYRDESSNKLTSESVGARLPFFPSAFAVPTGGLLGGACGYAIKLAFSTKAGMLPVVDWTACGGSVLLGLVFALLTARRPDTHKAITVEDFLGGFIVGVLTGMFSDSVMVRLRALFVGSST
jgi:hypothetical protein